MGVENLTQNLITVFVLLGLFILVYLRMTNKTIPDMIKDIRESLRDTAEETPELMQGGFESIR